MSRKALFVIFIVNLMFFTSAFAASDTKHFAGQQPTLEELKQAQAQALSEGKLFMLVLGADWCHDSRALMDHFSTAGFSAQLSQRFVVAPYDVGYVDSGFAVAEAYGQPTYYGTPTVMIIDPASGKVLNKADWQHWTNAASHSAEAFTEYFISRAFSQPKTPDQPTAWQQQVSEFEAQQAARVRAGFQAVSPLLKAYMESDAKQPSKEFSALWSELATFRNKVFDASVKLYGQTEASELPVFAPTSWEQSE